jgi:hypothetical protein
VTTSPANDTPDVLIEIRAAELASIGDGWWNEPGMESEMYGVLQYHNGGTPGADDDGGCSKYADDEWAGWLACEIARSL